MIVEQFDVFFLDLDGVVYIGRQPIPGAKESVQRLRDMGKQIRFMTNNPCLTRMKFVNRLSDMGIVAEIDEMITSGWAAACYLRQQQISTAYVIGTKGLKEEICSLGTTIVEQSPCDAVVVGENDHATFWTLTEATMLIQQGAQFLVVNPDTSFPVPEGRHPAGGAIAAAIQAATGVRPIVIGKPSRFIFDLAMEGLNAHARIAMVGDTITSDMIGAKRAGITSVLIVPSGHSFPDAQAMRFVDATIPNLSALFESSYDVSSKVTSILPIPERLVTEVAVVVFNRDGKVLLVKDAEDGLWTLPTKLVETGETIQAVLQCAVYETTGRQLSMQRLVGIYSNPALQTKICSSGEAVQFVTICCACTIVDAEIQPAEQDTRQATRFSINELPSPMHESAHQWLADALANQPTPFVR